MAYNRARTLKGRYKGDDKTTLFNEAWVKGRSPNWIKKRWQKLQSGFGKAFINNE